jgi:hypothetical protein
MAVNTPYITFVAASRNDNHGGDMTKRMVIFIKGLIHQCNKFKLPAELIMVEWNPPRDKPYLIDVLPKAKEEDFLKIRYIIVPPEIHQSMNFSERMPLFQMIAKNVGIRRASAEFVLCTNIDLIFSDELFRELSKKNLKNGKFYRAVRCDIPNSINDAWEVDKMLDFSRNNIVKYNGKHYKYPILEMVGSKAFLYKYSFFAPLYPLFSYIKSILLGKNASKMYRLDKEACGDFTMMSKQDWEKIEGYPELEIYSLHIDSMALIAADSLGIKQEIFKPEACSFHISHKGGWEFADYKDKLLFYTNKPVLDWWAVYEYGLEIIKNKTTWKLNRENWGLADVDLKELS